jgi:hypothetical protein
LFALLSLMDHAEAQSTAPQPVSYTFFSVGFGALFPRNPGSPVNLNFKYTSTSVTTGVTTTQTFSGTSGAFLPTAFAGDMIHGGYVFNHNSINVGIGYNYDMNSTGLNAYIKLGYGYIFRMGAWQVQPSVDLYVNMDGPVTLGNINNSGVDLSVLGDSIHSRFYSTSYSTAAFLTSQTTLLNATDLEIKYARTSYLAEPKLVVGMIWKKGLYLGVEGGWMLQMAQTSTLKLEQNEDNVAAKIHISQHGSLGGPAVGLIVGWCFYTKPKKK